MLLLVLLIRNAIQLFLLLEVAILELLVLEDVEKMKNKGLIMINMSAKEFDKRFDNGEDIDTLMKNPETLTITDLENIIKDKKHQEGKYSITLDLNNVL